MASVRVRVEDFADQRLPRVCAVTGKPADQWYRTRATRSLSGVWFLLIGVWFFLLPRSGTDGWVPMADDAVAAIRRNARRALWVVAGAAVVLLAAFALRWYLVVFLDGGIVIGAWFLAVNTPGSVGARLERDVRWVRLEPVHPAFVAVYDRQLQG